MNEDAGLCREGGELLLNRGSVFFFFVSYRKKKKKKKEKSVDYDVTV